MTRTAHLFVAACIACFVASVTWAVLDDLPAAGTTPPASGSGRAGAGVDRMGRMPGLMDMPRECAPDYPLIASLLKQEGVVYTGFQVQPTGETTGAYIVRSSRSRWLDRAARGAVAGCRFSTSAAALLAGKKLYVRIAFRFSP